LAFGERPVAIYGVAQVARRHRNQLAQQALIVLMLRLCADTTTLLERC